LWRLVATCRVNSRPSRRRSRRLQLNDEPNSSPRLILGSKGQFDEEAGIALFSLQVIQATIALFSSVSVAVQKLGAWVLNISVPWRTSTSSPHNIQRDIKFRD
jgi:hypothetical protein